MNLQAEKLEVVRMILDGDDKTTIMEVKSLFEKGKKTYMNSIKDLRMESGK